MSRDLCKNTNLLRWQYYTIISGFTLVLTLFSVEAALAQAVLNTNGDGAIAIAQDHQSPVLSEHGGATVDSVIFTKPLAVVGKPPLPFSAPPIGPSIRQVSMDDIAHRTTAFIPQSLDQLTPITMPHDAKWIRVDLSEQTVVAYEKNKPIRAFLISSGLPGTATVTGRFHIRMKVEQQTMVGGVGSMFYNLPGVKWVQYFYEDYGFHGTYWHSNFGHPMSHGCINMTDADAKWLFDWAGPIWDGETEWFPSTEENPGTLVIVTD